MQMQHIVSFTYQQPEAGFLYHGCSHSHYTLIYALSGCVHAVVEGRDLALSPGELVLCGPEQFHMLYAQEGESPCFLQAIFDGQGIDAALIADPIRPEDPLNAALAQLVKEAQRPDSFSEKMVFSLLSVVVLSLCRRVSAAPASLPAPRPQQGENEIIRRAQQYISHHIREKLSVTLVAARIDLSPSYMTALFHKHLAISPGEYIRRAKLQESKRLIQEGTMNFTEIASALEYSTVHHFSRQFKEHFGITPTQYAKSIGEQRSVIWN